MTRPRKHNRHLPEKMYFKHGRHWYVTGGKWRPLDPDLGAALGEYAKIIQGPKGGMANSEGRAISWSEVNLCTTCTAAVLKIIKPGLQGFPRK